MCQQAIKKFCAKSASVTILSANFFIWVTVDMDCARIVTLAIFRVKLAMAKESSRLLARSRNAT